MSDTRIPQHILVIGAGVFGLSTTLSLLSNPTYRSTSITIVDASPSLPNPSGSSVDANRIVRADYTYKHYSRLALEAQELWRDKSKEGWGGEERYHEPGFVITADEDKDEYVTQALLTVRALATEVKEGWVDVDKVKQLNSRDEIRQATGYEDVSGDHGYANFNSGWADAEACVAYALRRIRTEGHDRVFIRSGAHVERLLFSGTSCTGVELKGGEQIIADLTVLAAGAWSPSLIDLQDRCLATGQTLAFVEISEQEQASMENRPTVMNMSQGMFIIPPRGQLLKIARHGYGYRNMVKVARRTIQPELTPAGLEEQDDEYVEISIPEVGTPIPLEAQEDLRQSLRELVPQMADRPFIRTRICWYCDT